MAVSLVKVTVCQVVRAPPCSLPAPDVSQEARVLGRFGAQVFGFGHVEQHVHDVGRDVQGQREPAPAVPLAAAAAVAQHLTPELGPAREAVVRGAGSPFFPAGLRGEGGGGGRGGEGGEVLRGLQQRSPAVHGGVAGLALVAPDRERQLVAAQQVGARVREAQAQAAGRRAQDRQQQQGLQGRQHAESAASNTGERRVETPPHFIFLYFPSLDNS